MGTRQEEDRVKLLDLINELSEAAEEKGYRLALWHASKDSGASKILQKHLSMLYEHSLEEWEDAIKDTENFINQGAA